ncbi:TetR family transcriptional regulator [Streptomyces bungoensis]|uniref:TetR family transcriptional regulator n=1 Tax=Streptomyces bungoensis TaxID=285568 RepID=A0A117RB22_9ACTN|nr:ScbR family autoregulator-binding transcription factor [Streptomyces bungoensis]KUN80986.1 TetR family transcriptional regulator [Streptomyces bungoensis]
MQERAKETRRSLLEAAAQLFAEHGYAATSVNNISARSGRTSGAVYFHYAGKEGIAVAVVRDRFADWSRLAARYADEAVPPVERLVALSYDIAHALSEEPVTRAGARLWAERATINAPLPDPFALWTAAATRLLAQARLAGQLNAHVRPAHTARALVRAFFGLCALTEALESTAVVIDRLTDWWQLTLPSLQPQHQPQPQPVREDPSTAQ